MKQMTFIICGLRLLLLLFFLPFFLFAESEENSGSLETKSSDDKQEKVKKKKIGVDQSDFMPAANKFGLITTYSVSYNDLQQVEPKTTLHRLGVAGTYSFDKNWSSYGSLSMTHQSYGTHIVKDHDTDDFHEMSNLNIGVVYSQMQPLPFVRRSSNTLNIGLPLSRPSRVDKHLMNLSFTNFIQSYSWKDFSIFSRITGNFLWQTQRFSLFRNDQASRDWLLSNSLGVNYMLLSRVGLRFNYRWDGTRHMDRTWNLSFGNNFSIFANYFGAQMFFSMINNSYEENERIDLGYYDRFRRLFLGGVTYVF